MIPAGSSLESFRETIASPQSASQGFSFDDAPQQRKGDQQQQSQPRNLKRDETWRDELDQQLEA
ncbi:MAG: hypothetical protein FJW36_20875 [Acidobacteria bacterium]|nr:hypothetical protein [Acidobacteriota bacterium]